MAREIPVLVRAAAGLAATVLDEARKLPETLPGLPVRIIGLAMQRAMRIQQQYAGLVARGDELFTGIRGEDEPGLATFDDDEASTAPASGGFRESAFDRVDDLPLDDGPADDLLADDPAVEAIVDQVELAAVVVEDARETVAVLAEEAPDTDALLEEVLDEIAIDDLVADAPKAPIPVEAALPAPAPAKKAAPAKKSAPAKKAAPGKQEAPAKPAASEPPAKKTAKKSAKKAAADTPALPLDPEPVPTLEPRGTAPIPAPPVSPAAEPAPSPAFTETSLAAPPTAPIDGYDFFSLAQLRGHLRGYAAPTVEQLLAYEKAGLAREPYLRMLRNRLERLRSESA